MDLKFSHVDVLVSNLEEACAYYARVFSARVSRTQVWERGGLHVRYAVVMFGTERFMLVQPIAGNLKALMDSQGEGTIYRHCYSTLTSGRPTMSWWPPVCSRKTRMANPWRVAICNHPAARASCGCPSALAIFRSNCWKKKSFSASSRMRLRALREPDGTQGLAMKACLPCRSKPADS